MAADELLHAAPERVESVLLRYAGPGPRYTSYPTAPAWSEDYGPADYARDLAKLSPAGATTPAELSVYVHVPFCQSLCHFCACNRIITRKRELPEHYLGAIEREIESVRAAIPGPVEVAQHHWGGGTPTHLGPDQIRRLFAAVDAAFPARADAEISIEVDPRVTNREHLAALRECGFHRISMGVQDFDERVQQAIHRIQPAEDTARLVEESRAAGFRGVGFDLIYGLPHQTVESFEKTLDRVISIGPDRIAIYGYAHVTWVAKQQRGFERGDLPEPATRLRILLAALRRLLAAGYAYIGLDHFARPDDELSQALGDRTLRRNFMGYTTRAGLDLVAFGPSAISELSGSYAQSQRDLGAWEQAASAGRLATLRGQRLTDDDLERRWVIQQIMCLGELRADDYRERFGRELAGRFPDELARLEPLEADGLVVRRPDGSLHVPPLGRLVLRNVAMAFDAYLPRQLEGEKKIFSQTV